MCLCTMMPPLPGNWNTSKRKAKSLGGVPVKRQKPGDADISTIHDIQEIVRSHLRRAPSHIEREPCFDTSSLLETIPFVKILNSIGHVQPGPSIPLVSRVYEERFMRQSHSATENDCVMGQQCECMIIDNTQPFVGTQFILPNVEYDTNGMCVLCLRKTTQLIFYKTLHQGLKTNVPIQKYGNICNEPGEYHPSAMLVCPSSSSVECMPLPIVAHQRNRYSVKTFNGYKHIAQRNVYMEDFP